MIIDEIYNCRQACIPVSEVSEEWKKECELFEKSLSDEQIDTFHKILDCVSDTAADEMRAAHKVGFKDGVTLMKEIQE